MYLSHYYTPEKRLELAEYDKAYREGHHAEKLRRDRQYRKANVDAIRVYDRLRAPAKNSARRGAGGSFTSADVEAQKKRQKGRCYWCHARLSGRSHVDHVVPISRGGSNHPANFVAACPSCNLKKGAQHPMDWAGVMF